MSAFPSSLSMVLRQTQYQLKYFTRVPVALFFSNLDNWETSLRSKPCSLLSGAGPVKAPASMPDWRCGADPI